MNCFEFFFFVDKKGDEGFNIKKLDQEMIKLFKKKIHNFGTEGLIFLLREKFPLRAENKLLKTESRRRKIYFRGVKLYFSYGSEFVASQFQFQPGGAFRRALSKFGKIFWCICLFSFYGMLNSQDIDYIHYENVSLFNMKT